MIFGARCFNNPPQFPCDVDFSVEPVAVAAVAMATAIAALGFFALVYLLATRKP